VKQSIEGGETEGSLCYRRQATCVLGGGGVAIVRGGDIVPLQKLLLLGRILFSLFLQPVVPTCYMLTPADTGKNCE
jgi:hypothetical protein